MCDFTLDEIIKIGRRVQTLRKRLQISQRQLADKINAEKNVIQRIENGNLKSVNEKRMYNLAIALDCSLDYLLLESDDPRTTHYGEPPYYDSPEFQYTAEQFLYSHMSLKNDFTYISKYMHKDFQEQIVKLIHTMVTFHKCGVHYPNTTPEKASSIGYETFNQTIKDIFFKKEASNWERPR